MPTFPQYFGMEGDPDYIARVKGDVVALLQAGCCVGALLINFLAGNGMFIKDRMTMATHPIWVL